MPMTYKRDVLLELKKRGINQTVLRKEHQFGSGAILRLKNKQTVSWVTISRICDLLQCQPDYFLVWDKNAKEL